MTRLLRTLTLTLALFAATVGFAAAERLPGAFTLTPELGWQSYDSDFNLDSAGMLGLAAGYNIDRNWTVELGLRYAQADGDGRLAADADVLSLTVDGLYHFPEWQGLTPYLLAGVGLAQYDIDGDGRDEDPILNWGGGVKYPVVPGVDLRFDLRHVLDFNIDNGGDDDGGSNLANNFSAAFGLTFQFDNRY